MAYIILNKSMTEVNKVTLFLIINKFTTLEFSIFNFVKF